MANNYTEFSEVVSDLTDEERQWFEEWFEEWLAANDDSDEPVEFVASFEDAGKTLWIRSEESGDIDGIAGMVQEFLAKFRPDQSWSLSWAATCSGPRVGEFGGGAIFVTAQRIEFVNSWGWAEQKANGTDLESIARTLLDSGDDEGCDGLVVVDREAFLRLREAVEGGKL